MPLLKPSRMFSNEGIYSSRALKVYLCTNRSEVNTHYLHVTGIFYILRTAWDNMNMPEYVRQRTCVIWSFLILFGKPNYEMVQAPNGVSHLDSG